MSTMVNGSTAAAGEGGAVYTSVARPSDPVTIVRAESEPKSCGVPFTMISARSGTLRSGWPLASRAVIVMTLCDAPSCDRTSGETVMATDVENSEGPARGGASCFFIVQPASVTAAASSPAQAVERCLICISGRPAVPVPLLGVSEVAEIRRDPPRRADRAARHVAAVEGDLRDRRD